MSPCFKSKKTHRDRTLEEGGNLVRKGKREEGRDGMSVREKERTVNPTVVKPAAQCRVLCLALCPHSLSTREVVLLGDSG